MKVKLSHASNPDIQGGYWSAQRRQRSMTVFVTSIEHASKVCQQYISDNDLGGGNWTGGQIIKDGKVIGHIAYNGRFFAWGE